MMKTVRDAETITMYRPLTSAISTKQDTLPTNRDSVDDKFSRFEKSLCPAYSVCRGLKKSYRLLTQDADDRGQQVTILRDLLQAIKETALRLQKLIANSTKRQQRNSKSSMCYDVLQDDKNDQQNNPESELTIMTASNSICALCGAGLHLENPPKKSKQFALEKKLIDDHNRDRNITSKNFDDVLLRIIPCETARSSSVEVGKKSDRFFVRESVPDHSFSKENNYNVDTHIQKEQKNISKIQSVDTRDDLRSKLLFIRQFSPAKPTCQICPKISQQRSQAPTKMFYPYTCELLVTNRTENEVSIERKVSDDTRKIEDTKMQKLEKDKSTVCCSEVDEAANRITEKVTQQQLQAQVKELHKNIQHFREENAYLQYLIEKCRCPSERTKVSLQLLLIRATYRGFATAIEFLRVKCCNGSGLITMLTNMLQRSINIQQITNRLLAFVER